MFDVNQSSGVETRPSTRQILELSKLSRLPSLSNRKPLTFKLPAFPAAPEIRQGVCAACEKRIERDSDFLQNLNVCRKCVGIHARVETAIDSRAVEKTRASKLAEWSKKLEADGR